MQTAARKTALQIQAHFFCPEMLEIAAEAGFRYIAMGFGSSRCFHEDGWEKEIETLSRAIERNGLACVMTHAPYYDLRISAEITDDAMETALLRCTEATAALGAEIMAIHPRGFYRDGKEDTEQSYYWNRKNLTPLVEMAKRCGCKIGIENLPTFPGWDMTFYSNFPDEHLRLIDSFDPSAVCGVWDFGHSYLANSDPSAVLRRFRGKIGGTHVHDNHRNNDEHLIPFDGTIDWRSEMAALADTGFDGYLTMELEYEPLTRDRAQILAYAEKALASISCADEMLRAKP